MLLAITMVAILGAGVSHGVGEPASLEPASESHLGNLQVVAPNPKLGLNGKPGKRPSSERLYQHTVPSNPRG